METQPPLSATHPSPPKTLPEPATKPEPLLSREAADELRTRNAHLSALYVAGARLSAILDWDPLIRQTLETTTHLVKGDGASLMLLDERCGELYFVAATRLPPPLIQATRMKLGEGMIGWVAEHREAVLLNGPIEVSRFPGSVPKPEDISSAISVPLIPPPSDGKAQNVLGVLSVHRQAGTAPFSQEELELVTALSTQAAAALLNARVYRRLYRKHTQLQHLVEIGSHLTTILETDTVLNMITAKAIQLLHCEAGSLLLVDEENQELVFQVAIGPTGAQLIEKRLPMNRGIAGTVARTGVPLIVNDAMADPRHDDSIDSLTALLTRSLLCVPLKSNHRTIGVLEVMNKTDGTPFDEEDAEALGGFAMQSTIALENARLYSDLKLAFRDTVRVIANAVEARDPHTAGHSERVTQISLEIAKEMGWKREQLEVLEIGALLHDIGKIGVEDSILRKPSPLTDEEYAEMKQHPVLGARVIESVSVLRPVLPYILYHQEHYDGQGYPFGLHGTEIPIEGRLLAVVDSLDAMTSDRPYHGPMSLQGALDEIVKHRGTQFDPDVVDALLRLSNQGKLAPLYASPHVATTSFPIPTVPEPYPAAPAKTQPDRDPRAKPNA